MSHRFFLALLYYQYRSFRTSVSRFTKNHMGPFNMVLYGMGSTFDSQTKCQIIPGNDLTAIFIKFWRSQKNSLEFQVCAFDDIYDHLKYKPSAKNHQNFNSLNFKLKISVCRNFRLWVLIHGCPLIWFKKLVNLRVHQIHKIRHFTKLLSRTSTGAPTGTAPKCPFMKTKPLLK